MKKQLFFTFIAVLALLFASCGSRRTATTHQTPPDNPQTTVAQPQGLDGSVAELLILPSKTDESLFQVEFVAGKDMLIDCNTHVLIGQFEKNDGNDGSVHLTFITNGLTVSTQMACLDNTQRMAFVSAQPLMMPYNSAQPIVVHAPQGITVRHRLWQAGTTYPIPPIIPAIESPATRSLQAFPTQMNGFNRFVLILPTTTNENNKKVEIIVGKIADVDCNRVILGGTFSRQTADGWGFDYIIFHSDGILATTRMACLEPAHPAFVTASQTEMMRYNSQMPVVVFAPIGFEVRYRIWEAPNLQ